MQITLEDQPAKDDVDYVSKGLYDFNMRYSEADNFKPLHLFARDESGRLVGGLLGGTWWRWLHVDILWVEDACRGQGIGQALMARAETEAKRRGCEHAHLETHAFQAPRFYEKLGYRIFGELDDFPPGHKKYWLVKQF